MKHTRCILLFIGLLPFTVTGQMLTDFLVKTRLLTDAIAQNPNLEIEKVIGNNFSIEAEGIWRRRDWATSGGEGDFGRYYNSQGFTFGLITRYYFSKKYPAPNAWYIAGLFRYNSTIIKNLGKRATVSGFYSRTVDLYRQGPEIGFLAGRQFQFNKFTSEINFGLGYYWQDYEEVLVDPVSSSSYLFVDGKRKEHYSLPRPYLLWTIGYYLTYKKAKKNKTPAANKT